MKAETVENSILALDWNAIVEALHTKGYALVPNVLTEAQCSDITERYDQDDLFRKKVVMERHRFGKGEYKYFTYPLPTIIQQLREALYTPLTKIANAWMQALKIDVRYPEAHERLRQRCHENGQKEATPLLLKYGIGGFNTLHQDLYGNHYFPIQAVFNLTAPDIDFTGGEFVLTQQVPRAQSKATVLNPQKGDMVVFATNFRPVLGTRGYYRAKMRHGVSELKSGERYALGIIFHDAKS
ncbi:2OG-Fe(II) oxygenase [Muricauda sp. SCSIO 64092]|uniref:2OG-Fe(II) oxygenase n=1 Tax=Allomuricauda sp. SCSIO 64092 TaxID=2908842 RepID=UPI001FF450B9|nr:2OG-Fe(II) oxygenase [Muricauda sp. SCSIO 64092]UOY06516.1 2OG-Fe(II) oxygenase [Muricauda sp. SCSIO 64092]